MFDIGDEVIWNCSESYQLKPYFYAAVIVPYEGIVHSKGGHIRVKLTENITEPGRAVSPHQTYWANMEFLEHKILKDGLENWI